MARPKPKSLESAPALFRPSSSGPGFVLVGATDPEDGDGSGGGVVSVTTGEDAAVTFAEEVDPLASQARDAAAEILARLSIRRPPRHQFGAGGRGETESRPYRGVADEIDLDRTLDVLVERRPLAASEIFVREQRQRRRAVLLAVDVSGSMHWEQVELMAATVGALSADLGGQDVAIIAFWSDAAVITRFGEDDPPMELVDRILRLPGRGLTNVAFPLEAATEELSVVAGRERRVLLLSDCVHNAGPDPRVAAARLPRLDVLVPLGAEFDLDLARDLARAGRGLVLPVEGPGDVIDALNRAFESSRA